LRDHAATDDENETIPAIFYFPGGTMLSNMCSVMYKIMVRKICLKIANKYLLLRFMCIENDEELPARLSQKQSFKTRTA